MHDATRAEMLPDARAPLVGQRVLRPPEEVIGSAFQSTSWQAGYLLPERRQDDVGLREEQREADAGRSIACCGESANHAV